MAWATRAWGLSLLLVAGVAWAEETKTYPESGTLPYLGLDDTSAPTQVQDGRATDLQNVLLDVSKSLQRRFGIELVGNSLDVRLEDFCTVAGLYYTKFSSGTERIVTVCGNRFYYLNGADWTQVTGATITAGANNQFVWATALDNIIGVNNADAPIQYDGTTLTTVNLTSLTSTSRPTTAKTVAFFKNFLILGNTVENSIRYATRIRWSNVGSISAWTDEDYIDIGALGGQEINGMAELYDNLYIFLTDSIYRVSFVAGADTFQVSKVTDDIGCIAKNSIQSITLTSAQNGLIFLDKEKKIYFLNGIVAQDISPLITNTLGSLGASRLQYAVSTDTNTDYWLCATNSTGSTNDVCIDFQYQIGEWTKHTGIAANTMAHVLDANGRDQDYFGTHKSYVYQLQEPTLRSDVATVTGIITSLQTDVTKTTSGSSVLYVSSASYTVSGLIGAPLEIMSGPGVGQTDVIITNTTTGITVSGTFATNPVGASFNVGRIDGSYTTKWYDLGSAARMKFMKDLYFRASDENTASGIEVSYATNFNTDIETQTISLDADTGDAIWGSAIWGISTWGSDADVFRPVHIGGEGRYVRVKWTEDDPDESFHLFTWTPTYTIGDVD